MNEKSGKRLNFFEAAVMYVGIVMGAAFASGRESWQFFGVFGDKGWYGVIIEIAGFTSIAMMMSYISMSRNTTDIGEITLPIESPALSKALGYILAVVYYTTVPLLVAAGGSFISQETGVGVMPGSILIAFLTLITVLGDFERVSGILKKIVPLLFAAVLVCALLVIFSGDITQSGPTSGFKPSKIASNWVLAALIFVSYNAQSMTPMSAAASLSAKNRRHALAGAAFGGIMLGGLTLLLLIALRKDMAFTDRTDLPMLAYAKIISPVIHVIFGAALFAAIYSSASSLYYGFTTIIPEGKVKKYIVIAGMVLALIFSRTGFRSLIAYLLPVQGYYGFIIITLITIRFVREVIRNRSR